MSTTLIYNGVEIRNCLTKRFDQECVYDDSGTDLLYHKFTVRVLGYIHRITQSSSPTVGVIRSNGLNTGLAMGAASVAQNQGAARTLLMEPRRDFVMTVGGFTLLKVSPRLTEQAQETNPNVHFGDVNSGPKPRQCNIVNIVGTELLPIEFEIELCVIECDSPRNQSGVLNNRWSMKDDIDQNWYTTRAITGRLRVADVNLNPQAFRAIVVPPLQAGFKRENITTTTSMDGLTLDYTVVDREVYAACPKPGTTWTGTHAVTTGDGAQTHGEINIMVEGPKSAEKREMIALCALITQQKLDLLNLGNFILQAAIIDTMHLNKVEMRVLVDQTGAISSPMALLNLPANALGQIIQVPDYDKDTSRVPEVFGTATVTGLFVSYLQSPCLSQHGVPQTTVTPPEPERGDETADNPKTYTYRGVLEVDAEIVGNYDSHAREGVYSFYEVEASYDEDHNTVQLPIARPESEGNEEQATAVFVRLAGITMKRRVRVRAQRNGHWPLMPAARSITVGSQRIQILRARPRAMAPQITADGKTLRHEIEVEYDYGLSRRVLSGEVLQVGKIPWDTRTLEENAVPAEVFSSELLL